MSVTVTGDATQVQLQNKQRKYDVPGDVPAGRYLILASFDESPPVRRGEMTTSRTGGAMTVDCAAATTSCTPN